MSAVPNDVHLSVGGGCRGATIITGPNMGGKSTYVRMVAVLAVLGQVSSRKETKKSHSIHPSNPSEGSLAYFPPHGEIDGQLTFEFFPLLRIIITK